MNVEVWGTWDKFDNPTQLEYRRHGLFSCEVEVPVGEEHRYRFLVDDEWVVDYRVPSTVKNGNEFNLLLPTQEEQKSENADVDVSSEVAPSEMAITFDQSGYKVGRRRKKKKRRHGHKPSIDISLPHGALPRKESSGEKRRRRRRKNRKKQKSKETESRSPGNDYEDLLKKKEEQWSRICFIQNLRQQQAHSKELGNVKKLWKQERQVRTEMQKKVVDENKRLESDVLKLEADKKKLQTNIEHDKIAVTRRMEAMEEETERLRNRLEEVESAKKTVESQFITYKKGKTADDANHQDALAETRKELQEAKLTISTQFTEVETLTMKLENLDRIMRAAGEKHKMAIEAERVRVSNLQEAAGEDQEEISKLRSERNQLETNLRKKVRELQTKSDGNRQMENELADLKASEETLQRKIKQLKEDTTQAEMAEKRLKQAEEQWEIKIKQLKEECQILQERLVAADARNINTKKEYEEQIEKVRAEAESMKALAQGASKEQLETLNEQMKKQDKEINEKSEEVRTLIEKMKELESEFNRKSKSLEEANDELIDSKKEISENSDKLSTLRKELATSVDRCQSLEDNLKSAKKSHAERYEGIVKELANFKASGNNQDAVIEKLRSDFEILQERGKSLKNNLQKSQLKNNELSQLLESTKAELAQKLSDEQALETKLKNLRVTLEDIQNESRTDIAELNKKIVLLKSELTSTEEKNKDVMEQLQKQKGELEAKFSQRDLEFDNMELKLKKITSEFEIEKNMWEQEKAIFEEKVKMANTKDERLVTCCKSMFKNFQDVRQQLNTIRSLKINELDEMNEWVPSFEEMLKKTLSFNEKLVTDTMEKYKRELSLRRKYFNLVQELRGNIRVFCRVRPLLGWEKAKGLGTCVNFPPTEDFVIEVPSEDAVGGKFIFEYDRVYKPHAQQSDITEDTSEYVQSVMDGYNVSIFAYGQTGSGKTWTMEGPIEDPGVNLHALQELFKVVSERVPMFEYTITMSVYEIYNNEIKCLLSSDQKKKRKGLKVVYKARATSNGVVVDNGKEIEVKSREDVLKLMAIAKSNRRTACTKMNDKSSRSHMVVIVSVRGFNVPANIEYQGKLFMVDLAGSERVAKSGVKGKALKEAAEINKSLSALGDVMQALQKKTSYVPYRNSTLTYLMQNALGGHAKTIMFINICPTDAHLSETLGSLRFAQRVAKVELGKAQKTFKKVDRLNRKTKRR